MLPISLTNAKITALGIIGHMKLHFILLSFVLKEQLEKYEFRIWLHITKVTTFSSLVVIANVSSVSRGADLI